MTMYALGELSPNLARGAWAAPSADLIGDVRLGARASVWFHAVIRADNTCIDIGTGTNIQDGSVCHSDSGFPLMIGDRVTVGHQAILHGCAVASECLIGMGARILNGAVIETGSIVGAGALVTEGKSFPARSLIIGSPARAVREVSEEELRMLRLSAEHYAEKASSYAEQLKEIGAAGAR